MSKDPGVFVLITGDDDYYLIVLETLNRNWKVEIWFWTSGPFAKRRKSGLSFYSLDDCYRYFTYASELNFEKNHVFEITD
ncbi:1373_t:CDS:2, partial [Funneliformis geosporum]